MSDGALLTVMMMGRMDAATLVHNQVRTMLVPLLEKPAGGWRPIGLSNSFYSLWGRLRRPRAAQRECDHPRSYLAAGKFAGAADVVWRRAARADRAVLVLPGAMGPHTIIPKEVACKVLWDLMTCYETIGWGELECRAEFLNVPPQLSRVSAAAYKGPGYLSMASQVNGPHFADIGVIAACSIATTYVL
eukprot:835002-Pyramimonas_sp.AAC.1